MVMCSGSRAAQYRREIVLEHEHVVPDIERAGAVAEGLGHEGAALVVDIEGDRIAEHRLARPQRGGKAGRKLEFLHRHPRIVPRRGELRDRLARC